MTSEKALFRRQILAARMAIHAAPLLGMILYQFFFPLFTGFFPAAPVYLLCALILAWDVLQLLFFPKIWHGLLFFGDSAFLAGLVYALGAAALPPVLLLAFALMAFQGLALGMGGAAFTCGWLALLLPLALILRAELSMPLALFLQSGLALSYAFAALALALAKARASSFAASRKKPVYDRAIAGQSLSKNTPTQPLALALAEKTKLGLGFLIHRRLAPQALSSFIDRFIEHALPLRIEELEDFEEISDLNSYIKGFVQELRSHPEKPENLSLRLSLSGRGAVKGSVSKLKELFSDLLINSFQAVKAARRAKGEIIVSTYNMGQSFAIEISDNGIGIEGSRLGRIFEPLFSQRIAFSGGLGLSLAQKIAKAHGGYIELMSGAGEKTRARARLPLVLKTEQLSKSG